METIEGTIKGIIFRNEENGYTVLSVDADGEEITATGYFDDLRAGESVALTGHFADHASYGPQFRTDSYEIRMPETAAAALRYLSSGAVKGIGEALAGRIVKRFGDDTFRIMQEEPERLAEIKGISMRMAQEISGEVARQQELRDAVIFLQDYGIQLSLGIRIFKEYGGAMYAVLRENPYRLAEDIDGIGFRTADGIAAKMGVRADAPFRVQSAVIYILSEAAGEGSVYLPQDELVRRTAELLELDEEAVEAEFGNLAVERRIVCKRAEDTVRVYHPYYYETELAAARMLTDLSAVIGHDEAYIEKRITKLAETSSIELDEEQLRAVRMSARYGLLLVTGGPGTGKTTAMREIIRYFEGEGLTIALAAPTGRAAKRITEATGYPASTVHRLLEIAPGESGQFRFTKNEAEPLEADVIIIDEVSMVDIVLLASLLRAVPRGARLILVGDANQLPSVGPGSVLRDILRADCFPSVRLTRIFRQAESSDIVVNAHKINAGEYPVLDNKSRDFFFLRRTETDRIIANMIELIREKLPPYVDADPSEIQVLTPTRKGALGSVMLNRTLRNYLNPRKEGEPEFICGDTVFTVGDKVMQIRNDYQLGWEVRGKYGIPIRTGEGVFNGDIGVVREIDPFLHTMTVAFDEERLAEYTAANAADLELAYAVTIHKSQGSEYPAVIMPLLGGPKMLLTRNLLYTAVTRAMRCVVILGREDVLRDMIDNRYEQIRYTSLTDAIHLIRSV